MTWLGKSKSLQYLGSLHGHGSISTLQDGELGLVAYEIDGYVEGTRRTANGCVEGAPETLTRAFRAGPVSIALAGGSSVKVVLADPCGGPMAELSVIGHFPL